MNIQDSVKLLYGKDTPELYANLKKLESISGSSPELYEYFDEFFDMAKSTKYGVRVRGFRLLCKQSMWDTEKKIDKNIGDILALIDDEKPTAVRMKLDAIKDILASKNNLSHRILIYLNNYDSSRFPESTQNLIEKDIVEIINKIDRST